MTLMAAASLSAATGLTSAQAAARLTEVGPNDPAPRRGRSPILGERVNAALIIAMVALSIGSTAAPAATGFIVDDFALPLVRV